jgi:Spy/CpxP family protein refolding chaperone
LALRVRQRSLLIGGALLSVALALGGCSSQLADLTPADAQAHSREPGAYLPVHDLPPDRDQAIITPEQRAKIEAELSAARDRQAAAAKDAK